MTDIATIPTAELIDDYYASKMDAETLIRLIPGMPDDKVTHLQYRIEENGRIMEIIKAELERRGQSV